MSEQKKWYIVHTQTGYENKVRRTMLEKLDKIAKDNDGDLERHVLTKNITDILVPEEKIIEVKSKKEKKRKFFPGYVIIEMDLVPEVYWFVKSTGGVTGFLGDPSPLPLSDEEQSSLKRLIDGQEEEGIAPKPAVHFERGENIRITEGPFKHFLGAVEEVNHDKGKVKVIVTVFDRPTPVELDFLQVEKV